MSLYRNGNRKLAPMFIQKSLYSVRHQPSRHGLPTDPPSPQIEDAWPSGIPATPAVSKTHAREEAGVVLTYAQPPSKHHKSTHVQIEYSHLHILWGFLYTSQNTALISFVELHTLLGSSDLLLGRVTVAPKPGLLWNSWNLTNRSYPDPTVNECNLDIYTCKSVQMRFIW